MQSLVSAALGQEEPAPEPLAEPTESQAEALGDAEALIGICLIRHIQTVVFGNFVTGFHSQH